MTFTWKKPGKYQGEPCFMPRVNENTRRRGALQCAYSPWVSGLSSESPGCCSCVSLADGRGEGRVHLGKMSDPPLSWVLFSSGRMQPLGSSDFIHGGPCRFPTRQSPGVCWDLVLWSRTSVPAAVPLLRFLPFLALVLILFR